MTQHTLFAEPIAEPIADSPAALARLVAELRAAEDGISHRRCLEVAGEHWQGLLRRAGVAFDLDYCGIVRLTN